MRLAEIAIDLEFLLLLGILDVLAGLISEDESFFEKDIRESHFQLGG